MLSVGTEEITVDGRPPLSVNSASVGADYFAVLRLPLQQGRAFTPNDDRGAARVTIVNETLAGGSGPMVPRSAAPSASAAPS